MWISLADRRRNPVSHRRRFHLHTPLTPLSGLSVVRTPHYYEDQFTIRVRDMTNC